MPDTSTIRATTPAPPRKLFAFEDPQHPNNATAYRTDKPCVEEGCERPAGTAWSPLWCQPCNAERMRRIDARFKEIAQFFGRSCAD